MLGSRIPRAFTLVELLVVIAIIGVLIALLLPAVQSAREGSRKAQCANNLKQLAHGCLHHVQSAGTFPSGGWGFGWLGEPERSFGPQQPGGWAYSVLPFIEQKALHQMGAGLTGDERYRAFAERDATALPVFTCPTRRTPKAVPENVMGTGPTGWRHFNSPDMVPQGWAKTDYAANGGDSAAQGFPVGPQTLDCLNSYPNCQWGSVSPPIDSGVVMQRSAVKDDDVTDGMSMTLLLAEKYLDPRYYENGGDAADNQTLWCGLDWDTVRFTFDTPAEDTAGLYGGISTPVTRFGSAHALSFHAAACDGSVRAVAYTIDPTVWKTLGNRHDKGIASWK